MVESLLSAIAMMYVKVNDQDSRKLVLLKCIGSADRGIAKKAKPHHAFRFGVVSRRTSEGESIANLPGKSSIDESKEAACCVACDLVTHAAGHRVGIELT